MASNTRKVVVLAGLAVMALASAVMVSQHGSHVLSTIASAVWGS